MTVDEAIKHFDETLEEYLKSNKGGPLHKRARITRAREKLIKAVRDEALTKFADDLRFALERV